MFRGAQQGTRTRRAARRGRIAIGVAGAAGALVVPGTAHALLPVGIGTPIDIDPIHWPVIDPPVNTPVRKITVASTGAGTVTASRFSLVGDTISGLRIPVDLDQVTLAPRYLPPVPPELLTANTAAALGRSNPIAIGPVVPIGPILSIFRTERQTCTSQPVGGGCVLEWKGKPGDTYDALNAITISLSATPADGWTFQGFGSTVGTGGPATTSLPLTQDQTIFPRFADLPPTVALTGADDGSAHAGTLDLTASSPDKTLVTLRTKVVPHAGGDPVVDQTTTDASQKVHWDTTAVQDGTYDVTTVATDQASGQPATATRSIVVDNTAPELTFSGGPDGGQTFGPGSTQTWAFKATDATSGVAGVACKLDGGAFAGCTTGATEVLTGIAEGLHTLTVRAADKAGKLRDTVRTFRIDATPPHTVIASGPANGADTKSTDAHVWTFTAGEPGITYACRVYSTALTPPPFGDCTGPDSQTANGFPAGSYAFEVRGTDAVGNVETTPAKRTFTVTGAGGNTLSEGAGKVSMRYAYTFKAQGRKTWFTTFGLSGLAAGTKVKATCKGTGCPKKLTVKRSKKGATSIPALVGRKLGTGTRIELRALSGALTGRVVTLKITAPGKITRTERCLPGGKGKPQRCK